MHLPITINVICTDVFRIFDRKIVTTRIVLQRRAAFMAQGPRERNTRVNAHVSGFVPMIKMKPYKLQKKIPKKITTQCS